VFKAGVSLNPIGAGVVGLNDFRETLNREADHAPTFGHQEHTDSERVVEAGLSLTRLYTSFLSFVPYVSPAVKAGASVAGTAANPESTAENVGLDMVAKTAQLVWKKNPVAQASDFFVQMRYAGQAYGDLNRMYPTEYPLPRSDFENMVPQSPAEQLKEAGLNW
jgi:hypothetical protein